MDETINTAWDYYGGDKGIYFPTIDSKVCTTDVGTKYLRHPGVSILHTPDYDPSQLLCFLQGFDNDFKEYVYDNTDCILQNYQSSPASSNGLRVPEGYVPQLATLAAKEAGQGCYMSYGPKRTKNKDVQKYLDHILDQGHGCYDGETDVLTISGWKRWKDVSYDDLFATRTVDGFIEYHKPLKIIQYDYIGKMYRVSSPGVDLLVTPNHNMLVGITTTRKSRKDKSLFTLIPAIDLDTKSHRHVKTGSWVGNQSPTITGDICELLGFSIGDGYLKNKKTISFRLKRYRKIRYLYSLSSRLGLAIKHNIQSCVYNISLPLEYRDLFSKIYDDFGNKVIPEEVIILDKPLLSSLFEGLMSSDGHIFSTGSCYDTTSEKLAGQIQHLCLHLGICANISQAPSYKRENYDITRKNLYRVSIVTRNTHPEINKWKGSVSKSYWIDNWIGKVFCAEVPNNTLYVRRNGKPVWSGNSVLEHVNIGFKLWGIDRATTHELVRHRAGTAFSQASQRYVDASVLRFVERPETQNDETLHKEFIDFIDAIRKSYIKTSESLHKQTLQQKTMDKKKIQQASRYLLPNCTEAPMTFTANIRALRHIFSVRGSIYADPPIRNLAVCMYLCVQSILPEFFSDTTLVDTGNNSFGLQLKYPKV